MTVRKVVTQNQQLSFQERVFTAAAPKNIVLATRYQDRQAGRMSLREPLKVLAADQNAKIKNTTANRVGVSCDRRCGYEGPQT